MQEGRDHENESSQRDSAPSPSGEPTPGAGGEPQEGQTPGASWVPLSMTSPEDPPSGQAPGMGGGAGASTEWGGGAGPTGEPGRCGQPA